LGFAWRLTPYAGKFSHRLSVRVVLFGALAYLT
jgi:hypothetical protein